MATTPINRDDTGINMLKSSNTRPGESNPTDAITPYPTIHPEGSRDRATRRPMQHRRRHRDDRRHDDRREHNLPVVLDTRVPHDRRSSVRRRSDRSREKQKKTARKGINFYI